MTWSALEPKQLRRMHNNGWRKGPVGETPGAERAHAETPWRSLRRNPMDGDDVGIATHAFDVGPPQRNAGHDRALVKTAMTKPYSETLL